jgi:biopolymer transport protein ExbD/phage FluMu protein Com
MSMKFNCPACGKQLTASESLAGRKRACPRCRATVTVPTVEEAARTSPANTSDVNTSHEHPLLLMPSHKKHDEDLIDMTAMVDIVFFLLIFFMVTSMQALESVIDLPVPQADAASGVQTASDIVNDPNYVTVTIDDDDSVWVEQEEAIGEQDLRAKLRAARQADPDCRGMMVTGSPEASHGTFVMVIDAGAEAGLPELLFAVPNAGDGAGG